MKKFFKKIKYWLLLLFAIPVVYAFNPSSSVVTSSLVDIEMEIQIINPEFKKEKDGNIDREYHHYITPDGDRGFIIIEIKNDAGVISKRAYNPIDNALQPSRYYDWKIIKDNNSATTTDEEIN